MNVPELRFPEFSDDWNHAKLKSVSEEIKRTSESPNEEVLTISAGKGFITQKERWNKVIAGNSLKKYTLLKKNEFSYNRGNSKSFIYGCIYRLKNCEFALVPNVYHSFSLTDQNPLFYEQLFIGGHIDRQLRRIISSSARMDGLLNISKKDFFDVTVTVPKIKEQKKIGSFLSKVDEKIEKLQKKQELWQTYKKGIMQQIFSQELRFKDLNGEDYPDWEEKPLSDVSILNPKSNDLPEKFIYIDLESVESGVLKKRSYLTKEEAPSRAQRILKSDDILYQTVRPYQRNNFFFNTTNSEIYVASTGYAQIRSKEDPKFIYHILHTDEFVNNVLARCTGTSYPAINSKDLGRIRINIPSIIEQKKIAAFISTIDTKIELIDKKLKIDKEFKKGLLQQMFC